MFTKYETLVLRFYLNTAVLQYYLRFTSLRMYTNRSLKFSSFYFIIVVLRLIISSVKNIIIRILLH